MMTDIIEIEVAGNRYEAFINVEVTKSVENFCGAFNFVTVKKGSRFPFKNDDTCKIWINNTKVIDGFIERIRIEHGAEGHSIEVSGRDKTCDILDSTIAGNLSFKAPVTLNDVAKKVLSNLGISNIDVISEVNVQPFAAGEVISSEVGESAFGFIEKYARKRQVLVSTNGDGNIIFTQASNISLATQLVYNNNISNILDASATFDNSRRFYKYQIHTQSNISGVNIDEKRYIIPVATSTNIKGSAYDNEIRKTRAYNFQGETTMDSETAKKRCIWQANYNRGKALKYNCTIQGFTARLDKRIWTPNLLVSVIDNDCLINSELLINSVTYRYSLPPVGSQTTLELITKDAFTAINLANKSEGKKKSSTSTEGGWFAGSNYVPGGFDDV